MGQLRQAPTAPVAPAVKQIQVQAEPPKPVAPEPPRPVYETVPAKAEESVIDLSEPAHGGWLDAIDPGADEVPIIDVPEALASPAVIAAAQQPAAMEETAPVADAETAAMALNPPQTNISIQISMPNISMPKLHWPEIKIPAWPYRRIAIWSAVGAGSLVLLAGGGLLTKKYFFDKPPLSVADGAASLSGLLSNPTFTPFAPKTKPQLAQGKSQATAFDGKRDSYSYTDNIQNVPLTVSEQPIPSNFSSAAQAVASIAKSMNATHVIKASGLTAYEAKSSQTSTQTLILTNANILIFLQSNFPHDDGTWANYISSLQQPAN